MNSVNQCVLCDKKCKNAKKICGNCAVVIRRMKLKQQLVDYKGGKCELCGYNKNVKALSFHHLDPNEKEYNISKYSKSLERLKKEVDKCQLLCMNCHAETHDKHYISTTNYKKRYQYYLEKIKMKPTIIKKCKNCLCSFKPRTKFQIYCNKQCYKKYNPTKCPTKKELEILVWQKPSINIAKQLGVSDRVIGKWCKKYNIPKPSRGYWSSKEKRQTKLSE